MLGGIDYHDKIDVGAGSKRQGVVTIIDATEIDSEGRVERRVSGGFDMLGGDFDFDIGENLELVVDGFVIIFQSVEVGVAEEDGLELIVGGFRTSECGSEGEEIIVGLETGLFERGFEEVWARLVLVGIFIVGVFPICVILVGICEILLHSFKIWVVNKEAERSDSSRVVFC